MARNFDHSEAARRERDCDYHYEKLQEQIDKLHAKQVSWGAYRSGVRKTRPRCSCERCVADGVSCAPGFLYDLVPD